MGLNGLKIDFNLMKIRLKLHNLSKFDRKFKQKLTKIDKNIRENCQILNSKLKNIQDKNSSKYFNQN